MTRRVASCACGQLLTTSAITKVLSKRRRGLTMERLQEALPQFDERSLLNATFVMRRKGQVEFDRSGEGRGVYRW